MIAEEYLDRGYRVETFETNTGVLQALRPGAQRPIRLFSVMGEASSFVATRKVTTDKYSRE